MIKDKIVTQLKNAFLESLEKTKKTNREYGFLMCIDKDGKLSASRSKCEGDLCSIRLGLIRDKCPEKVQGFFHTHPQKLLLEELFNEKMTDEDVKELVVRSREHFKKKGITVQGPSHQDALTTLLLKCEKELEGTVCTGSDLETDKVECWTTKRNAANFLTCNYAKIDNFLTAEMGINPKKWIKPLFDKEMINLK